VDNPYPDLILGFTGTGSVDQAAVLAPGQSLPLTLRVFTQNVTQTQYTINLTLDSQGVTDSMPLTLIIQPPTLNVRYEVIGTDPDTLITQARLINEGETLTNFNFDLYEAESGLPANVAVEPDLHHVFFPAGDSIEFEIIPLQLYDGTTAAAEEGFVFTAGNGQMTGGGSLNGVASGGSLTGTFTQTHSGIATNQCDPNSQVYVFENGIPTEIIAAAGWFCTNKPDISLLMTLSRRLPLDANILSATFSTVFQPNAGALPHTSQISLDGNYLTTINIYPGMPPTISIPIELLLAQTHILEINTDADQYQNQAHFTVNTGNTLTVQVDNSICMVCATSMAEAQ